MANEAMRRLLDYDRRRYWLANGWPIRFRIAEVVATAARPHGIKYAFTLHDVTGQGCWDLTTRTAYRAHRPMTTAIAFGVRRNSSLTIFEALTN